MLILLLLSIKIIQLLKILKRKKEQKENSIGILAYWLCWHSTYENRSAFSNQTHLLTADQAETIMRRVRQLSHLLLDKHQPTEGEDDCEWEVTKTVKSSRPKKPIYQTIAKQYQESKIFWRLWHIIHGLTLWNDISEVASPLSYLFCSLRCAEMVIC